ncbi:MAG: hypothetical protein ED557_09560 [Balneola sp.]|nr:MAG: hypothetical protein ED557_09560 [Balneola sp.]
MKRLISILVLLLAFQNTSAQEQPIIEEFILEAQKSPITIRIDGNLDEEAWNNAVITSDFLNKWPKDEGYAIGQTKAWILYDNEYLYIGAINYQKKEDLVIKSLKRDNSSYHWESDAFTVVLDPYNQKTTGFIFGVNAAGAEVDGIVSIQNSRTQPDFNWNNTWTSSVKVHDDYWVAELAIPFKSINFDPESDEWGINFVRNDMLRNEYSTWTHVPQGFPGIDLGYLGTLKLQQPLEKRRQRIAVQPYMLSSVNRDFEESSSYNGDADLGLDAKIPLGSSLKMDLTVNPDFSTVDVDQQVTNLSRFSIFFPERRVFFLENSDLFSSFGTWGVRPFFSRQIGISDGNLVPILFGTRVTGNVTDDLRVGALNVQTKGIDDISANNYTVGAFQQNVFGRSSIKGLFTNRSGFDGTNSFNEDFNRTMGLEFHYASESGRLSGNARYHWSQTEDRLNDASFVGATLMYNDGDKYFGITADRVGDNYINDLGFSMRSFQYDAERDSLIRVGFNYLNPWAGFVIRPESDFVNSHEFSTWTVMSWETNGELIDRVITLNYELSTFNHGFVRISARNNRVRLLFPTDLIGGDDFLPAETYIYNTISLNYLTDSRGVLSAGVNSSYGGFYNGTRLQFGGELNYRTQPWGNFGVRYVGNRVELPDNYGEATLHLIGPQSEISFSNNLNWTTFLQYNTQAENFNINSRLQWRYAPMSDIFLVFNDNYGTENFGIKNRGVVFKMNYWFN